MGAVVKNTYIWLLLFVLFLSSLYFAQNLAVPTEGEIEIVWFPKNRQSYDEDIREVRILAYKYEQNLENVKVLKNSPYTLVCYKILNDESEVSYLSEARYLNEEGSDRFEIQLPPAASNEKGVRCEIIIQPTPENELTRELKREVTLLRRSFSGFIDVFSALLPLKNNQDFVFGCFSMFIILGIIFSGMFYSGINPLKFWDISNPRLPKAKIPKISRLPTMGGFWFSMKEYRAKMFQELKRLRRKEIEICRTLELINRQREELRNRINQLNRLSSGAQGNLRARELELARKELDQLDRLRDIYRHQQEIITTVKNELARNMLYIKDEFGHVLSKRNYIGLLLRRRQLGLDWEIFNIGGSRRRLSRTNMKQLLMLLHYYSKLSEKQTKELLKLRNGQNVDSEVIHDLRNVRRVLDDTFALIANRRAMANIDEKYIEDRLKQIQELYSGHEITIRMRGSNSDESIVLTRRNLFTLKDNAEEALVREGVASRAAERLLNIVRNIRGQQQPRDQIVSQLRDQELNQRRSNFEKELLWMISLNKELQTNILHLMPIYEEYINTNAILKMRSINESLLFGPLLAMPFGIGKTIEGATYYYIWSLGSMGAADAFATRMIALPVNLIAHNISSKSLSRIPGWNQISYVANRIINLEPFRTNSTYSLQLSRFPDVVREDIHIIYKMLDIIALNLLMQEQFRGNRTTAEILEEIRNGNAPRDILFNILNHHGQLAELYKQLNQIVANVNRYNRNIDDSVIKQLQETKCMLIDYMRTNGLDRAFFSPLERMTEPSVHGTRPIEQLNGYQPGGILDPQFITSIRGRLSSPTQDRQTLIIDIGREYLERLRNTFNNDNIEVFIRAQVMYAIAMGRVSPNSTFSRYSNFTYRDILENDDALHAFIGDIVRQKVAALSMGFGRTTLNNLRVTGGRLLTGAYGTNQQTIFENFEMEMARRIAGGFYAEIKALTKGVVPDTRILENQVLIAHGIKEIMEGEKLAYDALLDRGIRYSDLIKYPMAIRLEGTGHPVKTPMLVVMHDKEYQYVTDPAEIVKLKKQMESSKNINVLEINGYTTHGEARVSGFHTLHIVVGDRHIIVPFSYVKAAQSTAVRVLADEIMAQNQNMGREEAISLARQIIIDHVTQASSASGYAYRNDEQNINVHVFMRVDHAQKMLSHIQSPGNYGHLPRWFENIYAGIAAGSLGAIGAIASFTQHFGLAAQMPVYKEQMERAARYAYIQVGIERGLYEANQGNYNRNSFEIKYYEELRNQLQQILNQQQSPNEVEIANEIVENVRDHYIELQRTALGSFGGGWNPIWSMYHKITGGFFPEFSLGRSDDAQMIRDTREDYNYIARMIAINNYAIPMMMRERYHGTFDPELILLLAYYRTLGPSMYWDPELKNRYVYVGDSDETRMIFRNTSWILSAGMYSWMRPLYGLNYAFAEYAATFAKPFIRANMHWGSKFEEGDRFTYDTKFGVWSIIKDLLSEPFNSIRSPAYMLPGMPVSPVHIAQKIAESIPVFGYRLGRPTIDGQPTYIDSYVANRLYSLGYAARVGYDYDTRREWGFIASDEISRPSLSSKVFGYLIGSRKEELRYNTGYHEAFFENPIDFTDFAVAQNYNLATLTAGAYFREKYGDSLLRPSQRIANRLYYSNYYFDDIYTESINSIAWKPRFETAVEGYAHLDAKYQTFYDPLSYLAGNYFILATMGLYNIPLAGSNIFPAYAVMRPVVGMVNRLRRRQNQMDASIYGY